jgi:hypothetical protein
VYRPSSSFRGARLLALADPGSQLTLRPLAADRSHPKRWLEQPKLRRAAGLRWDNVADECSTATCAEDHLPHPTGTVVLIDALAMGADSHGHTLGRGAPAPADPFDRLCRGRR